MSKGYVVTIFKNISSTAVPYHKEVTYILDRIKTGVDLPLVNQIRLEPDKHKRNELKKQLPSIVFAGTFRQRSASGLIKPSGLVVLDFDNFKDDTELVLYRKAFTESKEKSKYTFAMFLSPTGKGLKVIVKIPPTLNDHKAYFKALQEFYDDPHFDASGSDICRVCYISADADLYYNVDSEMWVEMEQNEHYDLANQVPVLKLKTDLGIVGNLYKWFSKKYSMADGERNANLFKLASSFNNFGIAQHVCENELQNKYKSKTFPASEISALIKSAYKNKSAFATKFFEDKQSLDLLERQIKSGVDHKKIYKKLADEGKHSEDEVDNAIKNISDSLPISEFWYFNDKGKCCIRHNKFKEFLEQNGFYKHYPDGAENYIFVRIENNMIDNVTTVQIKDFVLNYLYNQSSLEPYELLAGAAKMFKDDYLNLIAEADITFFEDTQNQGVVYFNNGAAIVKTVDKITTTQLVGYLDLPGYVWRNHIINRDYVKTDFEGCVYDQFISRIAGNNPEKILSIKSTIGYLMHSFKTSANNKAVILNDETISDNPNGGSGKGVFCAALGHIKRLATLNGKTFDGAKSFAYQTVDASTQILLYDDIPKNFAFENLFSVVTEGITLEKKNKDAIKLSVGKSPKIIITTNYTIGGVGGSFERRKWEIEFSSYFNAGHTPLNEFGHLLFDEWSEAEWNKFDNLMIDCFRIYLENGLVKQEYTNLAERKFIKETSFDFHEWVIEEPFSVHHKIRKNDSYNRFLDEYPDYKTNRWFSQKRFSQWLDVYGKYKGYKVLTGKDSYDGRWILYIPEGATPLEISASVKPSEIEMGIIGPAKELWDDSTDTEF